MPVNDTDIDPAPGQTWGFKKYGLDGDNILRITMVEGNSYSGVVVDRFGVVVTIFIADRSWLDRHCMRLAHVPLVFEDRSW